MLQAGRKKGAAAEPLVAATHSAETPSQRLGAWIAALPKDTVVVVVVLAAVSTVLLATGPHDYPGLHAILDAAVFFLSALLALTLRDIGHRLGRAFPLWLAAGFATSAGLEFIHV